ncbi:MAG: FadR family transcriptional regulator [Lentisphaerae bacterium]|nr:FadR family transcriptional regulator [Lentisphaerota bacterium]
MSKQQKTLTEQVEERIYLYIRQKGYAFGDLLPKEEELASELEVSRTITREALSRLKASGVIESRRRRGMILKKPDLFCGMQKLICYDLLDEATKKEIAQLRLVIELGLSDLIYLNRTPEAIAELAEIAGKFQTPNITSQQYRQVEQDFHRRLFSLSGNTLIEQFQLLLEPFFAHTSNQAALAAERSYFDHMELVESLRSDSMQDWREKVHLHFAHYFC